MKFALIVNTCDKFEDCWDPFFKLFSIYWPNFEGTIYLNTEYKNYSYGDLNIIAVQGSLNNKIPKNRSATWSQCLKWALEVVKEDIVLYMQEDYFLNMKIQNSVFNNYIKLFSISKKIDCIHLTNKSALGKEIFQLNSLKLYSISIHDKDRISCQAALWKKEVLNSYLKSYESGLDFEWWGSKRSVYLNHHFYTTNKIGNSFDERNIISYEMTGVIGGKWYPGVVKLFKDNNIEIDFSKRGFFERQKIIFKDRLFRKLNNLPSNIRGYFSVLKLKYL